MATKPPIPTRPGITSNDTINQFLLSIRMGYTRELSTGAMPGYSNSIQKDQTQALCGVPEIFYPATAEILSLASTDANDAGPPGFGGTGAQLVGITGLDADYNVIQDAVVLNGTTPVNSNLEFLRVQSLLVLAAGATERNQGKIFAASSGDTFTAGVPVEPYMMIEPLWGLSACGIYTVPAGKTMHVLVFNLSGFDDKVVTVVPEVRFATPGAPWIRLLKGFVKAGSTAFDIVSSPAIPEKSDVRMLAEADAVDAEMMAIASFALQET